jgi:hypothetical protein
MENLIPGIPVSPDFNLIFQVHCNNFMDIPLRLKASFMVNGKITHNQKDVLFIVSGLVPQTFFLDCPDGILINASVDALPAFARDYTCFCNISLGQLDNNIYTNIMNLSKGHFRKWQPLCFPYYNDVYNDLSACNYVVLEVIPNAGSDLVFTCPPNSYMKIVSIRTSFTTNNTVKVKVVHCIVNKDTLEVGRTWAMAAQPITITWQYSLTENISIASAPIATAQLIPISSHRLHGDDNITLSCSLMDATDSFGTSRALAKIYTLPNW